MNKKNREGHHFALERQICLSLFQNPGYALDWISMQLTAEKSRCQKICIQLSWQYLWQIKSSRCHLYALQILLIYMSVWHGTVLECRFWSEQPLRKFSSSVCQIWTCQNSNSYLKSKFSIWTGHLNLYSAGIDKRMQELGDEETRKIS